jgi:hypothetical protein
VFHPEVALAREAVIVQNSSGNTSGGEAVDAAHYSDFARIAIGTLWIVGGLLGGLMFIIVPVVHLISTWALPLGGILLGLRAYRRRVVLYQVTAECPKCHAPIEFPGGSIDDPAWQFCPKCKAPLKVRPATG